MEKMTDDQQMAFCAWAYLGGDHPLKWSFFTGWEAARDGKDENPYTDLDRRETFEAGHEVKSSLMSVQNDDDALLDP